MPPAGDRWTRRALYGAAEFPNEPFWRSLQYFGFYRLIIAGLLVLTARLQIPGADVNVVADEATPFLRIASIYLGLCVASLIALRRWPIRFNLHLGALIGVDVIVFVALMQAAGGIRSGVGVLLLVSLAGAGLVGQGRLVLSYAAAATIALLAQQVYQALATEFEGAVFVQAGAMSLAFFAVAISARLLARRVVASEELARRRGEELQRQLRMTTRVIAMLDDGILVVSATGFVLQVNPRAHDFLKTAGDGIELRDLHPQLAKAFSTWRYGQGVERIEFRAGAQRTLLTARFIDVPEAGGDALIFLQDVGEQREIAQRQKLAALGRLTGGIAHEIRNPLSAIRYASELLKEDERSPADRRMLDIVLDNTNRLERIVHDVLELGRRDRAAPQVVSLALFLSGFASEFAAASGWTPGRLEVDPSAAGTVSFDPSHLRQVLWNLAGNAGRYASNAQGAVRISARTEPFELAVDDDGPGVASDSVQKLFEPFFTTHPQGNGLGLYIARELCEANGYRLHYEAGSRGGARFVMTGGDG